MLILEMIINYQVHIKTKTLITLGKNVSGMRDEGHNYTSKIFHIKSEESWAYGNFLKIQIIQNNIIIITSHFN